uniref:Uncharacterized protein n=1 Tax=Oryza rufipogon TaxID=4529 RepID=A0A0E0R5Y1_ORYRU
MREIEGTEEVDKDRGRDACADRLGWTARLKAIGAALLSEDALTKTPPGNACDAFTLVASKSESKNSKFLIMGRREY